MGTRKKLSLKKSKCNVSSQSINTDFKCRLQDRYQESKLNKGKFCPNCQVPFECLIGESINCHVDECLKIDRNVLPECNNYCCDSTIPSHYRKFSHFSLAAVRSGAVVEVEKAVIDKKILNLESCCNVENELDVSVRSNNALSSKRKNSGSSELTTKRQCLRSAVGIPNHLHRGDFCVETYVNADNSERKQLVDEHRTHRLNSIIPSTDKPNVGKRKDAEQFQHSKHVNIQKRTTQTKLTSFFKSTKSEENSSVTIEIADNSKLKSQVELKLHHSSQESTNNIKPQKGVGRNCPFYKKIPDTTFCVDAFSYGSIPGVKYYFLSHFHYDHYCGLKANFSHPIFCSKVTANLVLSKIRVQKKFLHILNLNEPVVVDSVEITALDANHCPGSFMFLFGFTDGRSFLHTGDFRASAEMESYPELLRAQINELYLDTTYCDPHYKFPSQQSILDFVVALVKNKAASKSNVLIVCGSYTIGKEKVFIAIAEALDCRIWANRAKFQVIRCLEDDSINNRLVSTPSDARVHVLPMNKLSFSALSEHLQQSYNTKYTEIVAIKPTGWEFNTRFNVNNINAVKPKSSGPVSIYGIPYSEHSSVEELRRFVQFLRPHRIIPTVSCSKEERNEMNYLFKRWLKL